MTTTMIAPKWVTWLLVAFGAAEVPWVLYLAFTQDPVVQAYHTRLAALGFGVACAAVCLVTAWGIVKRRRWAVSMCAATVALTLFTAVTLTLTPGLEVKLSSFSGSVPFVGGTVAAVAAALAGVRLWSGKSRAGDLLLVVCAAVLVVVAAAYIVHALGHLSGTETTAQATRMRAVVVFLDAFESMGLLGAGIASWRGAAVPTAVFGAIGAALLSADAWLNVSLAAAGLALDSAVFYLIVGEIPSIALCVIATVAGTRAFTRRGLTGAGAQDHSAVAADA